MTVPRRIGFTLIELTVALAIFSILLAGLLEIGMSLRTYADYDAIANDLEFEGKRVLAEISSDLSNSGRLYANGATIYPILYKTPIDADSNWDELEFLRLRTERTISSTPRQLHVQNVNFNDSAQRPVPFSKYWEGKPINSLILDPGATVGADLAQIAAPVWETNQSGLDYAANGNPSNARVFRYDLVDDQRTGRKLLTRKYKNPGDSEWSLDKELGANIDSFTVDLAESMPSLNLNQVRVSITLIRGEVSTGTRYRRVVETTIALRSFSPSGE
jgi:prepilin-type N-terminal cleavage/methylation domain-containing protein